jgi:uncharacterized protein YdeI (YjbR/CyaY-like superfamily)
MTISVSETVDVPTAEEWRAWLSKHHLGKKEVWVVFHKKDSGVPSISYDGALDEALAYGWIDSVIRKIDGQRYARKFTPRRPGSIWSRYNVERVERLRSEGRMTEWGENAFRKKTGEVSLLEKVNAEGAPVPRDFLAALRKDRVAWSNFKRMAPSHRKRYLVWLAGAKRPETRKKRIAEAVLLVRQNVKNLLK